MIVLSLFDGMSCGQIALKQLGVIPETYYASEIDKHAIGQTQLNFPNTIQLGSVVDVNVSDLKPIDLLIGGSPCQSFSFAGKRKGMATKCREEIYTLDKYLQLKADGFEFEGQSYLFWEYMRILNDIRKYNPDVLFLLENVEMGNKWERTLSEAIGIFGVHINSALISAQNRKRIYWTNIRTRENGLFGELHADIPQPKDKGILLKDILESEVDEKYYLSENVVKNLEIHKQRNEEKGNGFGAVFHTETDKMQCLKIGGKGIDDLVCVSMVGRKTDEKGTRKDNDPNIKAVQRLEPNLSGKTNCLTSVQKDNLVLQLNERQQRNLKDVNSKADTFLSTSWKGSQANGMTLVVSEATGKGFIEIEPGECFDFENPKSKTRRGRKMEDKSNCLMAKETDFMQYTQTNRIRRLTPTECARLQTVPDWYIWQCSDTQQYKMLGNGWTVEVIMHIFSFLPDKFKKP